MILSFQDSTKLTKGDDFKIANSTSSHLGLWFVTLQMQPCAVSQQVNTLGTGIDLWRTLSLSVQLAFADHFPEPGGIQ